MPVSFQYIQPNTLLPLFYAEVTSAQEPISPNLRLCLIGHMNTNEVGPPALNYGAGNALPNILYLLSGTIATTLFGRGSMLEAMYERARDNAPDAEIWAIACGTVDVSTRAEGSIEVTANGSKFRSGVGSFYIAGREVTYLVRSTDTALVIARNIQAAINSLRLPVKATGANGLAGQTTITITARWAGVTGNDIPISAVGPQGRASANLTRVNLTRLLLTFTGMAGGAGEVETSSTFASIGDREFDLFAFPQAGATQLDACELFMDNIAGRWSPSKQLYGHMVTTAKGNYTALYNLTSVRNDPSMSILCLQQSVVPGWEWTASLAAVMITHWAAPPELSRPLQTLPLRGMYVGSDDDSSFDKTERQTLLSVGGSTFHVLPDTTCIIDRVRTTRKYNAYGDPDPSWSDAIVRFQSQYFIRSLRRAITGAFPRAALTDEPTGINGFTSPSEIELEIIHEYKRLASLGLVENTDLFSRSLVVERDLIDRNRVNVLVRPDFVNQLRIVATLVETHLELDATDPLVATAA
jgi:phage tail sheath gpL-like